MLEFRLALRNLWRHKRRTILTGVVVAFGVLLFSAFDSLLLGFEEDSLRNLVQYESGEVSVHARGHWEKREELLLDRTIPGAQQLAGRLRRLEGVRGVTPQLVFNAAVNTGAEESPVKAIGTDPASDETVLNLRQAVKAGRYLRAGENEALLGRELAKLMDLKVGDTFTLVLRTQRTTFEALDLEVVGLLGSSSPAVNQGVYLPLDVAQEATGLPGAATQVLVRGEHGFHRLGGLPARLREETQHIGDLEVKTWVDWSGDYLAHAQADRQNMKVILGIVGVIAALGVVNSVLLAGMERSREIGTLKALGMTERQITRLFMLEGMGIGLFGGLLGVILSLGAVAYLTLVGIDYSQLTTEYDFGMAVEGLMRGVWNWPSIFGAWVFGAAFSFLVSYWPSRRSARLDPAVVLRG
ncbi:MAG: ABC transporter permease [Bacillota bacterium]|nr:ABC transporter permease [Bacillota bacterium]